jgi:D-proline reductase (dithiol) PrdB
VGLAARFLEEQGFATIVLTPTPEFHRAVGIPRSAAIGFPYGRPVGEVGDREGQRRVLAAALDCLEAVREPGAVVHLPFAWHQEPQDTKWHPPEMSPIIKAYLNEIKAARK